MGEPEKPNVESPIDSLAPFRGGLLSSNSLTTPGAFVAVLIIAALFYLSQGSTSSPDESAAKISSLEAEVKTLRAELKKKSDIAEPAVAGKFSTPNEVEPAALGLAVDPVVSPPSEVELQASEERQKWRAEMRVRGIERFVSLSAAERQALWDKFASDKLLRRADRERVLAEVLGEGKAAEYNSLREQAEGREAQEELDTEVIKLSRRLALPPDGEALVRDAIEKTYQDLKPVRDEFESRGEAAMELHSSGKQSEEALRLAYEEMRALAKELRTKEQELLLEKLRGQLTDAQLNEIAAFKAEQGGGFFGE